MENSKRLSEALKRHQLLVEYNFYLNGGMDEQDVPLPPAETPEGGIPEPEETAPTPAPIEPTPEMSITPPTPEEPTPNEEGEVEVDITDLVNSTNDTKDKIDGTNELLNSLISKFDELENKMTSFDKIIDRINKIEVDIEKRLPTPVEKLEMRSMDSYPYSVKLTDFWKDETEEIESQDATKQGEEYVLTPEDVKKDYNAGNVKNSFDPNYPID